MSARRSGNVLAVAVLCLTAGCARGSSARPGADTPDNAARQYLTALAQEDPDAMRAVSCSSAPESSHRYVSMMQPEADAVISVIESSNPSPDTWSVKLDWTRRENPRTHHVTSLPVVREGQRYFVCF